AAATEHAELQRKSAEAAALKVRQALDLARAEREHGESEKQALLALHEKQAAVEDANAAAQARAQADQTQSQLLRMREQTEDTARIAQETESAATTLALAKAKEQAEYK